MRTIRTCFYAPPQAYLCLWLCLAQALATRVPAAAAAMADQGRWWHGEWWVWDDNQNDWVHGGPHLDWVQGVVRAAAAKAAAVAAAPKQPAAVPKPIGLPPP